uniref:protein-disulfide reductase n=1 Tax=Ditylenchus dipsaci TaxID=166011 RepID=A0A915DWV2_9BILA
MVAHGGKSVKADELLKNKVVALYFSAGWCPPCRRFTPVLKTFYETLKDASKNFEVVFVSRDRDSDSLLEYYNDHHGKWAYIEFGDAKIAELLTKFEIKTIPALKVIKADGTVVVNDARSEVESKGANALKLFEEWQSHYES